MDGSAAPFVAAIDQAGIMSLDAPRRYIKVLKPVRVAKGDAFGELRPYDRGFRVDVEIDFDHPLIGRQSLALDVDPDSFRRERRARAHLRLHEGRLDAVERGLCARRLFRQHLVISDDRVLNADGLRYPDEFVRHKALDAIGDLALAGAPLLGAYRSVRGGHKLNHAVLAALMADPSAWTVVEARGRRRGRVSAAMPTVAPAWWLRTCAGRSR